MRGTRWSLALCLAALVVLPAGAAALGDWPSFHRDSRNTGFDPGGGEDGPPRLGALWWDIPSVDGALVEASPVVEESVLVLGDWNGLVRALDAETGSTLWEYDLKDKIVASAALWSGRAYVVDTKGQLVALDLGTGELLATANVGPTLGTPTIHEGKLFIGTEDGKLKAYTAHNLDLLWTFNVASVQDQYTYNNVTNTYKCTGSRHPAGQVRGAPAVFGGAVFFGSMNHHVYAVDEQGNPDGTTNILWTHRTGDIVTGAPAIDVPRSRVLFGSWDERLYAFQASPTGALNTCNGRWHTPAWTFQVPSDVGSSKVHSSPAVDATRAYFGANNGRVYSIDLIGGAKAWEYTTQGPVFSSPAVGGDTVVVGSDDGLVYWIGAQNGAVLASHDTGSPVKSSPALAGPNAFIASQAGTVYRFGPELPDRPDLVVALLAGDADGILITIANQGLADAGATTAAIEVNGVPAAMLDVPVIKAGEDAALQHAWSLENGTHEVRVVVDPDDVVWEAVESNNERSDIVMVLPPEPAEPPAPAPAPDRPAWQWYAAGGLILVALAGGGWLLFGWLGRRKKAKAEAAGPDLDLDELEDGDDSQDADDGDSSGYDEDAYEDGLDDGVGADEGEEYAEEYGEEYADEYTDEAVDEYGDDEYGDDEYGDGDWEYGEGQGELTHEDNPPSEPNDDPHTA